MREQLQKLKALGSGLILILITSCSWQYHISHYHPPTTLESGDVSNAIIVKDSVITSLGLCLRKSYLRRPDSAHYYSDCDCPNGIELDSLFGKKNRIIWSSINTLAPKNPHYLYSKSTYRFYDQQGRPIKQTTTVYEPDTNYQFQQYFSELGELEPKKLPYYYDIHLIAP